MLGLDDRNWGPFPFRSLDAWLYDSRLPKLVKTAWSSFQFTGYNGAQFIRKMKALKSWLKTWNQECFGNVGEKLKFCCDNLNKLEVASESKTLSQIEKDLRRQLSSDIVRLHRLNERMWKQKSREKWIKEGDRNTKFFHLVAKGRQRKKNLDSLMVDGRMITEPKDIQQAVVNHFSAQFDDEDWARPRLDGIPFKAISEDMASSLEAPFEELEIKNVVWGCGVSKAPGPDGFNFNFIWKMWSTFKPDVHQFLKDFQFSGKLARGVNSFFIALIPKVLNPISLKEFRPISLVGCLYKILAKLLANRIKSSLVSIISDTQSAFVKGRQILDGGLIANEVIDSMKKCRKGGVFLKIDFEKVYDCVNWSFLRYMLMQMGFGNK